MDLRAFLDRYTDEVYGAGDAEAARRFVADPCLRHEPGELVVMSADENVARIRAFLERFPRAEFSNRVVTVEGEYLTAAYELSAAGTTMSGIEIFRVRDGRIVETWNATAGAAPWG